MADFIPQPITMREIPGVAVVRQSGSFAEVNGTPYPILTAAEVLANSIHYVRKAYPAVFAKMQAGEAAAVVLGVIQGKSAQILLTPEQFAAGCPERTRYDAWRAEIMAGESARQAAERDYDARNNEGGEGYNPHRVGDERTYARTRVRERHFPEGA